jgi:hypothetical protein
MLLVESLLLLLVDVVLNRVFLLLLGVVMDVSRELVNVTPHEIFLDDFKLVLVLVVLLLLFDDQSVPVLQGVLCAPIEVLHNLRPLFRALVLLDAAQELNVLLWLPGPLLEIGVEVAVPVFTALLSVSKDLVGTVVEEVEFLRDEFPVLAVFGLAFKALLVDEPSKKVAFLVAPVVGGEVDLLEAEPLEHAGLASDAGDEGGEHFPVFVVLRGEGVTSSFSMSW